MFKRPPAHEIPDSPAAMNSLLETAKLNGVTPQEWLANVLDRIGNGHPINRIGELLPWDYVSPATITR